MLDVKLVIVCWFYVKNCIFEHMTDKFFPVTGPLLERGRPLLLHAPPPPKWRVYRPWLAGCWLVGPLVTTVSFDKKANWAEMRQRNDVLDGSRAPTGRPNIWGEMA